MFNNLFDGIVDDFMKKSDEFIDKMKKYEEEKNKISIEEKPQYEVNEKNVTVHNLGEEIKKKFGD